MVWLVQNCRSNKCLQFLNPQSFRGLGPGPAGDRMRSTDPSPTRAPITTNPGFAPDYNMKHVYHNSPSYSQLVGCYIHLSFLYQCYILMNLFSSYLKYCSLGVKQ